MSLTPTRESSKLQSNFFSGLIFSKLHIKVVEVVEKKEGYRQESFLGIPFGCSTKIYVLS